MGAFLAFIASPIGTLISYAVGALAVLGIIGGIYLNITHNAKREQADHDRMVVLEQIIKNQEQFAKDTAALREDQQKLSESLATQIQNINSQNAKLDQFLNSNEAQKADRPASSILKETIRQLGRGRK